MKNTDSSKIAVILHNIRSLHNVGSIFRTADAAGVNKIYLCGVTPGPLDQLGRPEPKFTKVSLGAEGTVRYERIASTGRAITNLKKEGYKILALEQSAKSIPYNKYRAGKNEKVALILGEETKGLSVSVLNKCDEVLEIPMRGKKESLNVSVAFGIAVYEIIKRPV